MDKTASGWVNGFIGVLIFSGSLPATRVAVMDLDPIFLTSARAVIAGLLGLALLLVFREKRPGRHDLLSLIIVALGVVAILHDLNLTAMFADRIFVMHRGRLAATGSPRDVLSDDLIEKVFDCRLKVGVLPAGNMPFVLPQSAA
ncbi:hypothetical protein EN746_06400 [Mesorhizobium sp. M8A.F.Ca.ET.023.02.2.1]|nr:hypothetical protein EN746_06400 [Mesorhizobium sp. M8A.F.Ca.ET.023.02.2.1]